jgi:hypothetical protein
VKETPTHGGESDATAAAVPLRPCVGMLAGVVLVLAMAPEKNGFVGMYSPLTITAALIACVLAVVACTMPRCAWRFPSLLGATVLLGACLFLVGHTVFRALDTTDKSPRWAQVTVGLTALAVVGWVGCKRRLAAPLPDVLAAALALLLSGEAIFCTAINPPQTQAPYYEALTRVVSVASVAGFVVAASLVPYLGTGVVRWRRLLGGQVVLLFVTGALLRFASAVATPDPLIDVYHAQQQGAAHLLRLENPYAADYPQIPGAPFYPPLPLLLDAPVLATAGDVRLGHAACDLVAALALFAAAATRREPLLGGLLAASYLHFPRVPLMMELAWYEPMLAATLGAGVLLVGHGWRLGYLLLGLGSSGKQYGVVFLPPLLKAFRGRRLALACVVALTGAGIMLPFVLWDAPSFIDRVVLHHLRQPVRLDGVTIAAAAKNCCDMDLPKWLLAVPALLLLGLVAWRTPARGQSPAPWMATSLLIFCLFFSQAFINYFYLCQFLLLLGLPDWFARDLGIQQHKVILSSKGI